MAKAYKRGRTPTHMERKRIRTELFMPTDHPFPKCPARSMKKARALADQGDPSHLKERHVCDLCRCNNTAGLQTVDDFYTVEGVGHYGVGFCWAHERAWHKSGQALSYARKQYESIRNHGILMAENIEVDEVSPEDLAVTVTGGRPLMELTRVEQTREVRNKVFDALNDMLRILNNGEKMPCVVAEELRLLREEVMEGGLRDKDAILERLDGIMFSEGTLTEKGGKGHIRMTDATRLSLIASLSKTVSSIGMDDFKMTEKDYIEKRVVAMQLQQTINGIGKVLAEIVGDEQADVIKQRLGSEVFIPVWVSNE